MDCNFDCPILLGVSCLDCSFYRRTELVEFVLKKKVISWRIFYGTTLTLFDNPNGYDES